jgi:putative acetyltransferase
VQTRSERPGDVAAIRALTIAAFENSPYGYHDEAGIIDALRAAGALSLSLIASRDGDVLGHVAFSPVAIASADEGWFGLGPVSVRPDEQGRGVGRALIQAGLRMLMAQDAGGCVVLGSPEYYGRFGFESDPALVFGGAPSRYFQRLVFRGAPPSGEVRYHPAFGA